MHEFEAQPQGTLIRGCVHYELSLGPLDAFVHAAFVRRDLTRAFDYRKQRVERLLPGGALADVRL